MPIDIPVFQALSRLQNIFSDPQKLSGLLTQANQMAGPAMQPQSPTQNAAQSSDIQTALSQPSSQTYPSDEGGPSTPPTSVTPNANDPQAAADFQSPNDTAAAPPTDTNTPDISLTQPDLDYAAPADANQTPALAAYQGFTPNSDIGRQYAALLGAMPQRTQPSRFRNIMGRLAMLGAGGPATYGHGAALGFSFDPKKALEYRDEVANRNYYEKLQDWRTAIDALGKGATEEDRQNTNRRIQLYNQAMAEWRQQNLARLTNEGQQRNATANRRIDVSQQRADAADWKNKHPDWKAQVVKGGNLIYVNPKDPTQIYDTGISSGLLTDRDKLKLQQENRIETVDEQGNQARQNIQARGEQTRQNIGVQGEETRKNIGARASNIKAPTDVQQKVHQYLLARQAMLKHPEWAQWIHMDTAGPNTFTVDNPTAGGWMSPKGPDDDTHQKIVEYITGADTKLEPTTAASAPKPAPVKTAPKPPGTNTPPPKQMVDPKGNIYDVSTWKAADIAAAKANGFKDK